MEKVIFDTQVARNPDAKFFLGNRNELEATVNNGQIGSIISDGDVKQFISTLYEKKKGMLAAELEAAIKERLD